MTTKYNVGDIVGLSFKVDSISVSDDGIFYYLTAEPKPSDEKYNLAARRIPEKYILPISKFQDHP